MDWISVEDKLPEHYSPVAVLVNNGYVSFVWQAMLDGDTWTFPYLDKFASKSGRGPVLGRVWTFYDLPLTVTHWAPYPEYESGMTHYEDT